MVLPSKRFFGDFRHGQTVKLRRQHHRRAVATFLQAGCYVVRTVVGQLVVYVVDAKRFILVLLRKFFGGSLVGVGFVQQRFGVLGFLFRRGKLGVELFDLLVELVDFLLAYAASRHCKHCCNDD